MIRDGNHRHSTATLVIPAEAGASAGGTPIQRGEARGIPTAEWFAARLSVGDEEKRAKFEELGFRAGAMDGNFSVDNRDVSALTMLLD